MALGVAPIPNLDTYRQIKTAGIVISSHNIENNKVCEKENKYKLCTKRIIKGSARSANCHNFKVIIAIPKINEIDNTKWH